MSDAIDAFLARFWARQPVSATFAGVHDHDHMLPDWSPAGLEALDDELASSRAGLAHEPGIDAELARAYVDVQRAELASAHGVRGNPALWTGEAVFGVVSLLLAPGDRREAIRARIASVPDFLETASAALGARPIPEAWVARALRDCSGGDALFARLSGGSTAREALVAFAGRLRLVPRAANDAGACGADHYDLLLSRGHLVDRPRAELLAEARDALAAERGRLDAMAREHGGTWPDVQARLAADHPGADDYLAAFARTWDACRARATECDAVTWPDWPIRYTTYPGWARDAAPLLYFLHYRSPAPFDPYTVHDYLVPANPDLRVWNHSAIKLNHVVHHGAVGHHVQNRHAYHQTRSRIGRIAAVDCASRIAMFQGGTMAEGWACYATALMDEVGFLTPLEQVSEQHSRVRFLVRAVTDLAFHERSMTFDEGVRLWTEQAYVSEDVGRAEMAKCAMFPGTAVMYWLGTQGILDLRERARRRDGAAFSLRAFHDELLGYGSLPVPLVSRLMTEGTA